MARGRLAGTIPLDSQQAKLLREAIERKFSLSSPHENPFTAAQEVLIKGGRISVGSEPHLGKQLARALGPEKRRRVLTKDSRSYFETLLGKKFVADVLALNDRRPSSTNEVPAANRARDIIAYEALKEKGLYEDCISLAQIRGAQAATRRDHLGRAEWIAHEFSCLRTLGRLTEALKRGNDALKVLRNSPKSVRSRPEALLLELKLEFGLTIAAVTMRAANFARGLALHRAIEQKAATLERSVTAKEISRDAHFYVLHARRQQAECLRYLGQYGAALRVASAVERAYPLSDSQPRFWIKVYKADNLRLLGRFAEALRLLIKLGEIAKLRRQNTALLSVEWRRLAVETVMKPDETEARCCDFERTLSETEPRNLWAVSYAHLALAAARVKDLGRCREHIDAFNRASREIDSQNALEQGYAQLIIAETERQRGVRKAVASKAFEDALKRFRRGGVAWGILRATIGLQLISKRGSWSAASNHLEGLDAALWQKARKGHPLVIGALCQNFP